MVRTENGTSRPVTVLLAVHDDERYLPACLDSVLGQSFGDFSFLVIDDASTDASPEILRDYACKDDRMRVITNERNIGLTASLNRGIDLIDSPYTARMDADDICLPDRLRRQYDYMEDHPELVVLGSYARTIDEDGEPADSLWFQQIREYVDHETIRAVLMQGESVIVHPSVFLRTSALKAVGGYCERFVCAQDYDLWLRLSKAGEMAVLAEELLQYRLHSRSISTVKIQQQRIANVCALALALLRERGEMQLPECGTPDVDHTYMETLADCAGPLAWARWLELNGYDNTELVEAELLPVLQKIFILPPEEAVRDKLRVFFRYQLHVSPGFSENVEKLLRHCCADAYCVDFLTEKINILSGQKEALAAEKYSLQSTLHDIRSSMSWKTTAPLRRVRYYVERGHQICKNYFE